ncbi:MAG: hypothetical protein KZQ89_18225 [Candidatus Thiodiazotropha sp. (ex Lucinoma kastoroae)]|nr:hypothetical protein [Candidatus Thiodiazotropha sp. (ex Rostrolucina anterorostrata)]MCU7849883.1 hypothetical protein [Candidatus Thiodiazotropha sp. (ex Lucinoma kastoroae)]MCU7858297.1 hypothetical protein [Candidatus Thiodiazotropha sp. (ex Lucinoma kastoroae)]
MRRILLIFLVTMFALSAEARDEKTMFSIAEAMNTEDAKAKLDQGIHFYFGEQKHPKVIKNFGEFMSNKKTNAFNKTDKRACQWAFLSAMLSFQQRTVSMGGNAVVNIRSYYKKNKISSSDEFECGAGNVIAGVTFLGDVVKIAE